MPLICGRDRVLEVYAAAAARGWVLPAFNSESLTNTEAVLAAALDRARELACPDLPIIVDITCQYAGRSQAVNYTRTGDWRLGLNLFLAELRTLTAPGSPFADLNVLVHLDHIQWDADRELLDGDLRQFSSIMFDASGLPFAENIQRTAAFIAAHGTELVIEGACDEIGEAGGATGVALTTVEMAERYYRETKADILVANLGTEHRASASALHYHGDLARAITERIGPRLCLHGTSSVHVDQVAKLFADGIRRVNLWTMLERDSAPVLLGEMLRQAAKIAGPTIARQWHEQRLLGDAADRQSPANLSHFATVYRQKIVFREMKRLVKTYLDLWYV